MRDAAGEPTGIIKDAAKEFVERVIPKPTAEEIDRAMRAGIDYALARGVTQVHVKAVDWATHYSLRRLRSQGETGIRFYSYVPLPDWQVLAALVEEEGRGDEWVRWGGLKGFVDGSLGSRTALFHEPYADAPDDHGIKVVDLDDLRQWIGAADSRGLQVAVHAIGDRANDLLLDMFADVIRANGERDRRFLVEHAQHIRPKSIARFRQLGVIPCMQPYHAIDDGRWAIKRIGPERLKGTYAFRSLLDQGALLSFGSDWPVAPTESVDRHRGGGPPPDYGRRESRRLVTGTEIVRRGVPDGIHSRQRPRRFSGARTGPPSTWNACRFHGAV